MASSSFSFSSTISQQPCSISSLTRGSISIPISKFTPFKSRTNFKCLNPQPRAALIEATPPISASRDGSLKVLALPQDLADDIQAEARALSRAVNAAVYTPQFVADRYGSQTFKVVGRALRIVTALGTFGLKLFLDQRSGVLDQNKKIRAAELRTIFTKLGPTFVKLGQGLSTRPDICPPEYLEELSELQDGLPTFPDEEAFECIERELGLSLDSIFSTISPSAVAAASLGSSATRGTQTWWACCGRNHATSWSTLSYASTSSTNDRFYIGFTTLQKLDKEGIHRLLWTWKTGVTFVKQDKKWLILG